MSLKQQLIQDEGIVNHVYQDEFGYWTIGVGHLVDPKKGGSIPDEIVDALLEWDIKYHTDALILALPWVMQLNQARRDVLINMRFNLGNNLLQFKDTLAFIRAGDYDKAADEMLASRWAKQVGDRAVRLSNVMRNGK